MRDVTPEQEQQDEVPAFLKPIEHLLGKRVELEKLEELGPAPYVKKGYSSKGVLTIVDNYGTYHMVLRNFSSSPIVEVTLDGPQYLIRTKNSMYAMREV